MPSALNISAIHITLLSRRQRFSRANALASYLRNHFGYPGNQKVNQAGHSPERAVEGHHTARPETQVPGSGFTTPSTTRAPPRRAGEFPRAGFLGVGKGACYWHGVGGFRRNAITILPGWGIWENPARFYVVGIFL